MAAKVQLPSDKSGGLYHNQAVCPRSKWWHGLRSWETVFLALCHERYRWSIWNKEGAPCMHKRSVELIHWWWNH